MMRVKVTVPETPLPPMGRNTAMALFGALASRVRSAGRLQPVMVIGRRAANRRELGSLDGMTALIPRMALSIGRMRCKSVGSVETAPRQARQRLNRAARRRVYCGNQALVQRWTVRMSPERRASSKLSGPVAGPGGVEPPIARLTAGCIASYATAHWRKS